MSFCKIFIKLMGEYEKIWCGELNYKLCQQKRVISTSSKWFTCGFNLLSYLLGNTGETRRHFLIITTPAGKESAGVFMEEKMSHRYDEMIIPNN